MIRPTAFWRSGISVLILTLLIAMVGFSAPARAVAAVGDIVTVPAIRAWADGPASTALGARTRIIVQSGSDARLMQDAATLAADLQPLLGRTVAVVSGVRADAGPSDVFLVVDSSVRQQVGGSDEGYRLESGGFVAITAPAAVGVFNGTRTLLQLAQRSSLVIRGGIAHDWPTYGERGLRLDTVPRSFSSTWWHNLIKEMAFLKLNMLQATALGGFGLTSGELQDIQSFAAKYHVDFIPTVAMAGHADPILDQHPELELFSSAGTPSGTGRSLDYTKLNFTTGQPNPILGYLDQFMAQSTSPFFHVSGDEYVAYPEWPSAMWDSYPQLAAFARDQFGDRNATAGDGYMWYTNWLSTQVAARGKTMRVWNDSLERSPRVRLDGRIVVEFWHQSTRGANLTAPEIAVTNKILNVRSDYLYYDMGSNIPQHKADPRKMFNEFNPTHFPGGFVLSPAQVTGAMIAVWLADPGSGLRIDTSETIRDDLRMPIRVLAQKTWDSLTVSTYDEFASADPGLAPGQVATGGTADGPAVWLKDGSAFLVRTTSGQLLSFSKGADLMWRPELIATTVAGNASVARSGQQQFLVMRTANGRLLEGRRVDGQWNIAVTDPGVVVGDPVVSSDGAGHPVWAARLADGRLVSARFGNPAVTLASGIEGDPVLSQDVNGKLTWFARTTSAALRHGWQVSAAGPWEQTTADLVTDMVGRPAVSLDASGKLTLFARKPNGDLVHRWQRVPGGGWEAGEAILVNGAAGDPAVALDAAGKLTLFIRKANGDVVHRWQSVPGGGWYPGDYVLLQGVSHDPLVVKDNHGRLAIFAKRSAGDLVYRRQWLPEAGWRPQQVLDQFSHATPAVMPTAGAFLCLMTTDSRYVLKAEIDSAVYTTQNEQPPADLVSSRWVMWGS